MPKKQAYSYLNDGAERKQFLSGHTEVKIAAQPEGSWLTRFYPAYPEIPLFCLQRKFLSVKDVAAITDSLHPENWMQESTRKEQPHEYSLNVNMAGFYERAEQLMFDKAKELKVTVDGMHRQAVLLRYKRGHRKNVHIDYEASRGMHEKLSLVVMLSRKTEWKGGEFHIGSSASKTALLNQEVSLDIGDAIVFPAYALHWITPVKTGQRLTAVLWMWGPPFT